jgi:hypothetical protein
MSRLLVFPALATSLSAAELLVNPGFETAPFPNSWASSGGAVTNPGGGLNGTAAAARLPFNTGASLSQISATSATDFTLDVSFQIAGTNEAQSFRMTLLAGGSDAIDLRAGTSGVLEVGTTSGSYLPLTSISDGATSNVPVNQTVKIRVIGTNFGTANAKYDLLWTAPYTGASVPAFTRAALGLTTFAGSSATSAPVNGVRFQRNVASANSFVVDDLSLQNDDVAPGLAATHQLALPPPDKVVNISGVYPHLAMTNSHAECGVGAVVPWAGRLWAMTYGPHLPNGSTDKLYEISPDLSRIVRSESVGGTPANRFIHTASNQLNIGPYFIDSGRNVRVMKTGSGSLIPGRITATAAHLTDPNRLYLFTMEDGLYDVNVNDLSYITRYPDVQGTGDRMLFGYHGKGAYAGQGLLAVANNGRVNNQNVPTGESGVLATWNGTTVQQNGGAYLNATPNADEPSGNPVASASDYLAGWSQVSRTQHCEVTGPGGIYGNSSSSDAVWSTGFDAKSVMLHVMEGQQWNLWRLPKGSYTHDGSHGWHTEWPRIRQLDPADAQSIYLMHMHGMFFDFPKTFSAANFAGLRPISSYYKMPTDYCEFFDGRIVMGKNDASQFNNSLALKDQSNLWFGSMADIENWGAPSGHGAVWMNEAVTAAQTSDPFLIGGFPQRTLHLRNLGTSPVSIEIQTSDGTPAWTAVRSVTVPANGYICEIVSDLATPWVRLKSSAATTNLTAFFHMGSPYEHGTPASVHTNEFAALADIRDTRSMSDGIIRVMNSATLPLEFASSRTASNGTTSTHRYHRIGGGMVLGDVSDATAESTLRSAGALSQSFTSDGGLTHATGSDSASAWVKQGSNTWRLPKLDPLYDAPFAAGWARTQRETVTERAMLNLHGTFYEVPRDVSGGMRKMRALATHGKRITDFASWRGLFVMSGVLDDAPASDKLVRNADGTAALWLGEIDDLWRMGEARGNGGPWMNTAVTANVASDPYLMYGYDRKELTLSATNATTITVEVDFLADNSWSVYQTFSLMAGQTLTHVFPAGFHAHWVRVKSSAAATATAQFTYGPADSRDAFLDWSRDHGLATGSGRDAAATIDTDGDGMIDLGEFVFGTDPHSRDANPIHVGNGQVEFLRRDLQSADGIACFLESSTTLADPWTPRPDLQVVPVDQSGVAVGYSRVRYQLEAGHEKFFVRARVSLSP